VLGPTGAPADKAKVWSSVQNESVKVPGGWTIEIPASSVPSDRVVMVWAAINPADLRHSKAVVLGNDHRPSVTIRISADRGGRISGWVRDLEGKPVNGALVSLLGQGEGAVVTELAGDFQLPVYTADGDQVQVQVAAFGRLKTLWVTAGDQSLVIPVERPTESTRR
jgi:hypothetical protein